MSSDTPHPSQLPAHSNDILHHYLVEGRTIQQIGGELNLPIPEVLEVIRSDNTQRIIRELLEAETQRQQLLRAVAVTRALHALTNLTDPEVSGTDRFLELQRKASSTLLREAASAARTHALSQRASRRKDPTVSDASFSNPAPSTAKPTAIAAQRPPVAPDPRVRPGSRTDLPRRPFAPSRSRDAALDPFGARVASRRAPRHPHNFSPRARRPLTIFRLRTLVGSPRQEHRSSPRARSPPELPGKGLKTSLFEKSRFFLPLCWHPAVPEACSVWSDRIARSQGIGSCCAAPRTWSAFSKGREVRCEECPPDFGCGSCVCARGRGSG